MNLKLSSQKIKKVSPEIKNNDNMKKRNKISKKNEFYSQSKLDQSTNIGSTQNKSKKFVENKILTKYFNKENNNHNIKIKSYKKKEDIKPDTKSSRERKIEKNNSKNNYMEKSSGRKKEKSKNNVKNESRNNNFKNKNSLGFKLLSDRSFNNEKNQTMNRFSKLNPNIIQPKPKNLKFSHSGRRFKEREKLSKTISLKVFEKLMNENGNKNQLSNNGLVENGINNNKNRNNNKDINIYNNSIFKTIQKNNINKIKNKHYNIISLDKCRIQENKKNSNKLNGMKKVNIINLNRAKSNIFFRKTSQNDIESKDIIHKVRKSNDIFIYTKHYGDHNKCPLCQSMEMKAKYSENKLGLHRRYIKPETEDLKVNTNNSIFKTIQKNNINKIKNKHYNIISLDKCRIQENKKNSNKLNGMKKVI